MIEENQDIQYHAARLLILIGICGAPISAPKIKGRTLLAKLDFFFFVIHCTIYLDLPVLLEIQHKLALR